MTLIRGSLTLLFALNLTACEIAPKQPDVHDFGLPVGVGAGENASTPNIDIDAPKWIWDTRIRYRLLYKSPTKVNFYMLDRWIATPPELFKQQLATQSKALRYPLVIKFLDFEQQFDTAKQAKVFMRVSVTALSSNNKPLATREFQWQRLTQTPDANGAVQGFAMLVRGAVNDIDGWLADLPMPPPTEFGPIRIKAYLILK
jgi:cholesterol transport system auxiliary component